MRSLLRSCGQMCYLRRLHQKINYSIFNLTGKRPWTRGYEEYKRKEISRALAESRFRADNLPKGYGFRLDERIIEYPWLFSRLPQGRGTLLDAGSALNHDFLISHRSLVAKRIYISTLAPEDNCFWKLGISYTFEDLRDASFRDNYFDYVVCISTLEHVGLDNTLLYTGDLSKKENRPDSHLDMVRQFHRILKPGGIFYLTLPFGKHIDRLWFQIFDAPMIDEIIRVFSPANVTENHFRYEAEGWRVSSRQDSKDAYCFDIHQDKEYERDFVAFSRAIVCLELTR